MFEEVLDQRRRFHVGESTVGAMELRIFVEPQQGADYETLLLVARAAEAFGFGGFFRSDHYLKMGDVSGEPGPTDAWVTLAGLARDTRTIRLGTLVSSATFRYPGPLAIGVAQVDRMSGGRVELGLGAGWYEAEHTAYGIPFPPLGERFERLHEQLAIVTGMWATGPGERFAYAGRHYEVADSPALPKPLQSPVPIIVGGGGKRRTPRLAAQFAHEFNLPFAPLTAFQSQTDRVRVACERIARDPATMVMSAALVACVGRDETEVTRRAAAIGRDVAELRTNGAAGTVDEVVHRLAAWKAAGAQRMYLQVLDLTDLDHLHLIAQEVLPHLR
jgi:F420-dependent oxidoreductase-like protein